MFEEEECNRKKQQGRMQQQEIIMPLVIAYRNQQILPFFAKKSLGGVSLLEKGVYIISMNKK